MRRFVCPKYERFVLEDTCEQCRTDPLFKQRLYLDWVRRGRAGRTAAHCEFKSADPVGETTEYCCGGQTKKVPLYYCTKLDRNVWRECFRCAESNGTGPCPKDDT